MNYKLALFLSLGLITQSAFCDQPSSVTGSISVKNPISETDWSMSTEKSTIQVLGAFHESLEFRISFTADTEPEECPDGTVNVMVDYMYLRDEHGGRLFLKQGSSVSAKGKRVQVMWTGLTCKDGTGPHGKFQIFDR
jgi:hypothetical protein